MTDPGLQTLLSSKAALDLGLISQADFDAVKNAFLRAQQIKAALDVGLIKAEDYEETKQSFLGALISGTSCGGGVAAATAPAPQAPAPAAAPAPRAAPPPPQPQPAPPAAAAPAPRPPVAPAPPPPVQQQQPAPAALAAAPAPAAPVRRSASNPDVPSNIPRVGGIKPVSSQTSMSGIAVTEDAVNLFYLMRLKATYKWALWQVDEAGTHVVIAAVGDKDSSWGDFLAALPETDCRYGVFDFDFTTPEGQKLHKMIFLNWAPDSARVKSKMMYASTKDFFKTHLDGISLDFQASDRDEISEQEVGEALRNMKRG